MQALHLSLAELRTAEQLPASVARALGGPTTAKQLAAQKRAAALDLPRWIKQHRFLWAVPVEQGEPSVALLLLWEADYGHSYPSQAVELVGRLSTFTKRLQDAVAADSELRAWLTFKKMHFPMCPGLPPGVGVRWAVCIDATVGEPFMGLWKEHLLTLVRRRHEASFGEGAGPPKRQKREVHSRGANKRKREGVQAPPLHTKQARVEFLTAALAAQAVGGFLSSASSSFSSFSGGQLCPGIGSGVFPPLGGLT